MKLIADLSKSPAALTDFAISDPARRLARAWLWLGIAALTGSGLLAILLVLARTPGMQNLIPIHNFFRAALVVHVDLSVLIWFMAFAAVLWSVLGNPRFVRLGQIGFMLASLGTALLMLAPFFPDSQPLLNNYIPMLRHPVFVAGLLSCGAGFVLAIVRALLTIRPGKLDQLTAVLRVAALLAAVAGAMAAAAFGFSWLTTPAHEPQAYYELLFWGGGHTLQFQHTLLLLLAWLWLAAHLNSALSFSPRTLIVLFIIAALPLLAVPLLYLQAPPSASEHIAVFLKLMERGHPLMLPLMLLTLPLLWHVRNKPAPARSALYASFFLFAVGGVLAFMIRGANVVVPAHYHGSIVGVTLAFMGLCYVLLPHLGFAAVSGKMARWQPYVYGGGQLLHISGLAWSGGYGVQRKVAGAEQVLSSLPQKIGMGLMGAGGLIAIIGGLMFVLVCLRAMLKARQQAQ